MCGTIALYQEYHYRVRVAQPRLSNFGDGPLRNIILRWRVSY